MGSSAKFYGDFTYYSILNMPVKKLAKLTKNRDFVFYFEESLLKITYYQEELRRKISEAVQIKNTSEAVNSKLQYIFGDHLPDSVLRKLGDDLTPEDLPKDS